MKAHGPGARVDVKVGEGAPDTRLGHWPNFLPEIGDGGRRRGGTHISAWSQAPAPTHSSFLRLPWPFLGSLGWLSEALPSGPGTCAPRCGPCLGAGASQCPPEWQCRSEAEITCSLLCPHQADTRKQTRSQPVVKSWSAPSQLPGSGHSASFSDTIFPSLPPSNTADL